MADTTLGTGVTVEQWSKKFFKEYIREERFSRYSGTDENNVFQHIEDLTSKPGDKITIHLVGELTNAPVLGDDELDGQEEDLSNYSDQVQVDQMRWAVKRGDHTQSKTMIDLLEASRYMLRKRAMSQLRDDKIDSLECPNTDGTTTFANSGAAARNAWETANGGDRVVYGALLSNRSAGDHATSLATLDTAADTLDRAHLRLLNRRAKSADPHITPITVSEDEEWFVAFTGTNPFRDLKSDLDTIHQNSAPRSLRDNPIYRDGDLVVDATIVREIPEMDSLGDLGDSGTTPVYVVAYCGAQASCVAWAKLASFKRNGPEGQDYGNKKGVAYCETRGVKKTIFQDLDVDHGMATGYVASANDA